MKNIILGIKGFIMGIANIIPGVSGGTLALTLGIYEDFIGALSHFFSNLKKNIKFLLPVGIGMIVAILSMSNVISTCFDNYPVPTTLFFMGLVIGGIPLLLKKVKEGKEKKEISSYIIALLTFSLVIFLAFGNQIFASGLGDVDLYNLDVFGYIVLCVVGIIAAATMVIPGVSGSLVLMLLGYYLPVINSLKDLTKFNNLGENIIIAGVFGVGVLIGIVLIAKLIEFLLSKFEKKTYFGVLGFIIASVAAIPISVFNDVGNISFDLVQVIIGVVLFGLGSVIGFMLGEK